MSSPIDRESIRTTLSAVLDTVIPDRPDAELAAAGELGIGDYVVAQLGEGAAALAAGLEGLNALASERGHGRFCDATQEERAALLRDHAERDPGLLPGLLFHAYAGYYQDLRVVEALGLPPRPPHPEGYPLEAGDLDRLEAVRARPRLYREV